MNEHTITAHAQEDGVTACSVCGGKVVAIDGQWVHTPWINQPRTDLPANDPTVEELVAAGILAPDDCCVVGHPDELAATDPDEHGPACESGWTGDRCTYPLFHEGPHSNADWTDDNRQRQSNARWEETRDHYRLTS